MQTAFGAILYCLVFSFFVPAHAYDVDTHFYSTYAMARHACIRHEVAEKIALTTQWMDESHISDPTAFLLLPITGPHQRRLLHFPSQRLGGSLSTQAQRRILGFDRYEQKYAGLISFLTTAIGLSSDDLKKMNIWTETRRNDTFASQLLMQGLKEGNLMKAAASLHVIEDSFAHAGTPAGEGHAKFWHWPDRPYEDPEKYAAMTRSVFSALLGIRKMLPEEAIDRNVRTFSSDGNCEMNAKVLAQHYFAQVKEMISYNVLWDKDYVTYSLRAFVDRAVETGYIKATPAKIDLLIHRLGIDGAFHTYEALQRLIKLLIEGQMSPENGVLKWEFILDDMKRLPKDTPIKWWEYIASFDDDDPEHLNLMSPSFQLFIDVMTRDLLAFNIPWPLDKDHRMELEDDTFKPRIVEMEIRIRNIREYIKKQFNLDIEFVGSNTLDEAGFGKEIRMERDAEPKPFPKQPGVRYATFSLREKNEFDHMIFHYLYPNTTRETLEELTAIIHRWNLSGNWFTSTIAAGRGSLRLWSIAKVVYKDTFEHNIIPAPDNFFYRNSKLFQRYIDQGVVQKLMTDDDVWQWNRIKQEDLNLR